MSDLEGVSNGIFFRVSDYDPRAWLELTTDLGALRPSHVEVVLDGYSLSERFALSLVEATRNVDADHVLLHAPYEDISLVTPWEDYFALTFDRMAWVSRLARRLGAHAVTMHAGMTSEHVADDDPSLIRRLKLRLLMLAELGDVPILLESARRGSLGRLRQIGALSTLAALSDALPSARFTLDLECLVDGDQLPEAVAERVLVAHAHGPGDLERLDATSPSLSALRYITKEHEAIGQAPSP